MKISGCSIATILVYSFYLNCTPITSPSFGLQDSKTSIRPDSFIIIPLKDIPLNYFAFSPLEQNKIWTTGVKEPMEIDLETGSVSPLSQKLGNWCTRGIKESDWATDPYEPEKMWFAQFDFGAVQWSKKDSQTNRFSEAKPTTCFAFQPKIVWIGTANGLYRYNRTTGKVALEKSYPNKWVSHIVVVGDSLILNNQDYYDPESGQYGAWRAPWADTFCNKIEHLAYGFGHTLLESRDEHSQYISLIWTKKGRLFKFGNDFRVAGALILENEVWSTDAWGNIKSLNLTTGEMFSFNFNQNEHPQPFAANAEYVLLDHSGSTLILEKKTGVFAENPSLNIHDARQVKVDAFNVYLLYNDRFKIISIDWLRKKAISIEQYTHKLDLRKQLQQEYLIDRQGFYPALARYDSIILKYAGSNDEWQNNMLGQSWRQVLSQLSNSGTDTIALVMQDMRNGRFSLEQQKGIVEMFFSCNARVANFEKAIYWGREYISMLDTTKEAQLKEKRSIESALKPIQRARFRFDSIDRYALSPAARLFAEADILQEYGYNSAFFAQSSCYDIQLARTKWAEIVKKYPRSLWADNASYKLLTSLCYGCGDGPGPEEMRRYADLLEKYPDTELKPIIWMDLAIWHLNSNEYDEPTQEEQLKNLKIAKGYLDLISTHYPEKTKEQQFKESQDRFNYKYERLSWEITISPEKVEVTPGEPIRVVVSVKNIANMPRKFYYWDQGYWMLDFQVNYLSQTGCEEENAPFFEEKKPERADQFKQIKPGETYREIIEISRLVNKRGRYGYFDCTARGVYNVYLEVSQKDWDDRISTSPVRILVR